MSIKCGTCDQDFLKSIFFETEGVKLILEMASASCSE
jgi:hypothetical protein